ncbi:PspC domain-containing protein [Enterococcus timonensis]|uniref:PspC domain-containing protein n=1 Tax=Enterococcus timonensis TaxID=1852364 RepID=UPI0008D8FE42|nr:PspC domain-containing protein [Enterococcus timonensis]
MSKKLKKSRNKVLTGTLAGIAEYFNIDPTILRVIYVIIILAGFGTPVILYFVLALIMPNADNDTYQNKKRPTNGDNPYYDRNQRTRKEAEKVRPTQESKDDEDWSDF